MASIPSALYFRGRCLGKTGKISHSVQSTGFSIKRESREIIEKGVA
jgi:hypothetical protein